MFHELPRVNLSLVSLLICLGLHVDKMVLEDLFSLFGVKWVGG